MARQAHGNVIAQIAGAARSGETEEAAVAAAAMAKACVEGRCRGVRAGDVQRSARQQGAESAASVCRADGERAFAADMIRVTATLSIDGH